MSFTRKNRKPNKRTYKRSGGGKPGFKTNKNNFNTKRTLRNKASMSQSSAAKSRSAFKLPQIGDYYPLGGKNHGYYYYATMHDGKLVNKLNKNTVEHAQSWMVYEPHLKKYKSKREIKKYLTNHLNSFKKGDEPAPPPGTTVPTPTILKK